MNKRSAYIVSISCLALVSMLIFLPLCKHTTSDTFEIRIRLPQDPETLNPVNYTNTYGLQIIHLLFQTLLRIEDSDGKLRPVLAQNLPERVQKDSLVYLTYLIREEAAWDNNAPVTAADVAFSVKVLKCPLVNNEKMRMQYQAVQNILLYAAEPKKVTFVCNRYAANQERLTGDLFILPAYLFDPKGLLEKYTIPQLASDSMSADTEIKAFANWFNSGKFSRDEKMLQGSGGYSLIEWKTGQQIIVQKKQNWWPDQLAKKPGYISANPVRIRFEVIPDNATALLALKSGSIDIYSNVPATEFLQLTQDASMKEKYNFFTPETYDFTYIGMNSRLEKFASPQTRQALGHLMDISNMIRITQQNFAIRTVGPVKPGDSNYNTSIAFYPYDVNKAVQLLQKAGWQKEDKQWVKIVNEDKIPLQINLQYKAGNSDYENIALIFKQAAAKAGIPVEIQPMEGSTLSANLRAHRFEVFIRSLSGGPAEYDFKPILHSESAVIDGFNYTGFGTAESDSLIEAINETTDVTLKAAYLKRFQQILYEEANPAFLFVLKNRIAVNKRLNNVKITTSKPGYDISALTLTSP